jgi:hypothetical protein
VDVIEPKPKPPGPYQPAPSLAVEQLKIYDAQKKIRDGIFAPDWQTIAQYFLPQDSDILTKKTEGVSGWTDQIYDATPIECAETLKTGQYNWLTPPQQPWAEYTVPPEIEDANGEAAKFLGHASDVVLLEFARCNFYSMASLSYLGCGVFGTDFLLCEENERGYPALNFRHAKIGTYTIEENSEGVVDTTRREFEWNIRKLKQFFGEDALPEEMLRQAAGDEGGQKKFKILHCIFPRADSERMPKRYDGANKPIASVYISIDFKKCIQISGYDEQPGIVSRFDKWGTDAPWGYSPAYLGLPIARQLNYVQMYMDALAELHAYPRVLIPDNLDGDVDLRAGGMTVWDSANPNAKPEEWSTVGDYKLGLDMQAQRRDQLRDAFKTKAFKLLNSMPLLDKRMTAFEISQRQAEMLGDFTPSFARRVTEFINPLMLRAFGICYRRGMFGQAPDNLFREIRPGVKSLIAPRVVVSNRMTDALRALKNRAIEETMQFMLPIAQSGKPEILDVLLLDEVGREYALNAGVPPELIRPLTGENSLQALRAQRAQMLKAQRAAQLAESMGKAAKGLGGAPDWMQKEAEQKFGDLKAGGEEAA